MVRGWPGSHGTLVFWPLNANNTRTTKVANLKFGMRAQEQCRLPTSLLKKVQNGAWSGSRDPANFWALSASTSSSKMVTATDFKFFNPYFYNVGIAERCNSHGQHVLPFGPSVHLSVHLSYTGIASKQRKLRGLQSIEIYLLHDKIRPKIRKRSPYSQGV